MDILIAALTPVLAATSFTSQPLLAAISSDSLLNALLWLVIAGIIVWLLWWGLNTINPPEPFKKVATVIIVLVTVVVLINILLGLMGRPLFR